MFSLVASDITISAPEGVGDVVSLTNELTRLNALNDAGRANTRIFLQPGTYDLRGVYMNGSSHLKLKKMQNGGLFGLGKTRGDTVLLSGYDSDTHRILDVSEGGGTGWLVVSNLTVTGGWASGHYSGGGICGSASCRYVDLIVSNNFAYGSWGAFCASGIHRGQAVRCLFADNRSNWTDSDSQGGNGGGFLVTSDLGPQQSIQGAWDCTFTNNFARRSGGGINMKGTGVCERCTFIANEANKGGGIYIESSGCVVSGCTFIANHVDDHWLAKQKGGGLYLSNRDCRITDCTFVGNYGDSGSVYSSGLDVVSNCVFRSITKGIQSVNNCSLVDCVVSNSTMSAVLYNCNLLRCTVRDVICDSSGSLIDGVETANTRTNACTLFVECKNKKYGSITGSKVILNCTYLDNVYGNVNYGSLIGTDAKVFNSVFSGNRTIDNDYIDFRNKASMSSFTYACLTNCVYSKTNGDPASDQYAACRQVARNKLGFTRKYAETRPYAPRRTSPLKDAGYEESWLLDAVGEWDVYRLPRRTDVRLDVGAAECNEWSGLLLLVR